MPTTCSPVQDLKDVTGGSSLKGGGGGGGGEASFFSFCVESRKGERLNEE